MIALVTLLSLGLALFVVVIGALALTTIIKAVLWVVLLPFRLLFGLILLPFLLLKVVLGAVLFLVIGPVVLLGVFAAVIAGVAAVVVPLFPLLCIAFVVWAVMRSSRAVVA